MTAGNLQQRKVIFEPIVGGETRFDLEGNPSPCSPSVSKICVFMILPRLVAAAE